MIPASLRPPRRDRRRGGRMTPARPPRSMPARAGGTAGRGLAHRTRSRGSGAGRVPAGSPSAHTCPVLACDLAHPRCLRDGHAGILRLPAARRRIAGPVLAAKPGRFDPASCSRSTPVIRSPVKRPRRIARLRQTSQLAGGMISGEQVRPDNNAQPGIRSLQGISLRRSNRQEARPSPVLQDRQVVSVACSHSAYLCPLLWHAPIMRAGLPIVAPPDMAAMTFSP